jgi:RNA polymerase sigma factor (sigma-70 family)
MSPKVPTAHPLRLAFQASSAHGGSVSDRGVTISDEPLADEDHPLFARAFREHYPDLVAFVRRHVRSDTEAADIAQEAYLRVLRYRDEADLTGLRMLVFRIALNLIGMRVRRSKAQRWMDHIPLEDDIPLVDGTPSQDREITAQQQVSRLSAALEKLPRKSRHALLLRRFHGLSVREIAQHMNIAPAAVEKLITRGAAMLVTKMGKDWP